MNDPDKGYCCDDYHQLIAKRVSELAEQLGREVSYIEIGTFTGNSAAAVLGTGKISRAVLIDNFCLEWKGKRQSKQMVEERLKDYAEHFEILEGDSRTITPQLSESFDVGFVDGDHSEESCQIDMLNMWPLIKQNGVMFIHDVGPAHGKGFTHLLPVVATFALGNQLLIALHNVSDGLAELKRK